MTQFQDTVLEEQLLISFSTTVVSSGEVMVLVVTGRRRTGPGRENKS